MTEKVTESIKFLMSEYKRLLIKQKDGTITKSEIETLKSLKNFLLLLIEKRRIFFVEKIFDNFLKLCAIKRGEIKASLISSRELSKVELDQISKDLSSSMGSNLKFDFKVDKDLIGGLKLQLGSFMIDTSIKTKLKKVELALLEN